jgi:putative acetyltransferase
LVADDGGKIIGHILFSPVTLSGAPDARIMGLAPMAVLPREQRHGVGTALVREGLSRCEELGYGAIVVVGHRDYYPRFGFKPATMFNLKSEYDVPDDVFMALELTPNYLRNKSGTIRFHSAFRVDETTGH